jgi:anion-transporting  ArsA/GET3 family ATPase
VSSTDEVHVADLAEIVRQRAIVVCCGSGGAGKTTTSAAIALAGAAAGRRACVVTIDPARRLADALGIGNLSNSPKRIEGAWPGELSAVMLDAKGTFDDLVARYSADEEQADRILSNRLYRNLTSALAGTQEYMAAEKLYELNESAAFDLVVVDTPPTRNALDFLDAPGRLTRFLENRIFRLLLMPTRASLKALTVATQALLKTISKVAGSEIVEDAMAFFRAFDGMEAGFRDRAKRVEQLLTDAGTSFVLVAAPRRDSVEEAGYFADRLAEANQVVSALIMNRLHPDFRAAAGGRARMPASNALAAGKEEVDGLGKAEAAEELTELRQNLADFQYLADRERRYLSELESKIEGAIVRVPYLEQDVHDLPGLALVAAHLMGEDAHVPAAPSDERRSNEANGGNR